MSKYIRRQYKWQNVLKNYLVACSKCFNSSCSRSRLASCEVARAFTLGISLKCSCEKSKRGFANNLIWMFDLNINVKCHINIEHEGSPWGIPLDFGWDGPMVPGDTWIYQILWMISQLDIFVCIDGHCQPKSMSISRCGIWRKAEEISELQFCETLKYWLLKSLVSPTVHGPEWPEFSAVIYNSICHSHAFCNYKRNICQKQKCLKFTIQSVIHMPFANIKEIYVKNKSVWN